MMMYTKRLLSFLVALSIAVSSMTFCPTLDNSVSVYAATTNTVSVKISVYQNYNKAYKVLELINKEREQEGLNTLTMDKSLLKSAMTRAAESALHWDHIRPDGSDCFTVSDIADGENIGVGASAPAYIMKSFMNSSGHKSNILDPDWVSVGIGCVVVDGTYYWSQLFSSVKTSTARRSSFKNTNTTKKIKVNTSKKYFKPSHKISVRTLNVGNKTSITTTWNNTYTILTLDSGTLQYSSSNPKICSVSSSGIVKAKKKGTAKISVWFPGNKKKAKVFKVTVK